nr:cupredoxin domain-containing protein [uncultured Roseateles sp.]
MRRRHLMLALGAGLLSRAGAQRPERVIAVVARKFVFLPNEITVTRGEPVVLELSAPEVVMGFHAPELQLRGLIIPGQTTRLRWTPERPGQFDFVCDVFCGDGHEGMSGRIIVLA